MKLPNGDRAILDVRKLTEYCLNPDHPRGQHKARVFYSILGLSKADSGFLQQRLLEGATTLDCIELNHDNFGKRYQIDIDLAFRGKSAVIRSLWIIKLDEDFPRFVTCFIKG